MSWCSSITQTRALYFATNGTPEPPQMLTCRRLARKQREAEWAAFNATRPDEGYEDQADLLAIRQAETSMGDFKLKSDPNYVAPEVGSHPMSSPGGGTAWFSWQARSSASLGRDMPLTTSVWYPLQICVLKSRGQGLPW